MGQYPPPHLKQTYQVQVRDKTFHLNAQGELVATREIPMGHALGYIQGSAYSFDTGAVGIVRLSHDVYVHQKGDEGNLLQYIHETSTESLVNVYLDQVGLVICTRSIGINEAFRLLTSRSPPCAIVPHGTTYWLRDTLRQALKENQWFRVPTALLQEEESNNAVAISVSFGGAMTFVPPTLAMSCELLVQYENASPDTVAFIDIDGIIVQVPCFESVIWPAVVTSRLLNMNVANHLTVHILSSSPMSPYSRRLGAYEVL